MSRQLGNELPEALVKLLDGHDLPSRAGKAILIATIDGRGWPHPALLSYGEIVAVDARRLRLATYRNSGTSSNMRHSRHLTLCLIEVGIAYYLKALAVEQQGPLTGFPKLTRFEATVEQVLEDEARGDLEGEARITGGIAFEIARPTAELLAEWAAMLRALRA